MNIKTRPYNLGFKDGFNEGKKFDSGLTWRDPKKNEQYDQGVNDGQKARRQKQNKENYSNEI